MIQDEITIAYEGASSRIITPLDIAIIQDKSLSLFQKTLLITNGTVTDLLMLYTGKIIKVIKIKQDNTLSGNHEVAFCPPEIPILRRSILLSSEKKNLLYAESTFIFDQLPKSIQYKLLETDLPIGLIWKEEKFETYREIIEYKNEVCETLSIYFDIDPQVSMLSRTYLIYHNNTILGIITEKFPFTYFK